MRVLDRRAGHRDRRRAREPTSRAITAIAAALADELAALRREARSCCDGERRQPARLRAGARRERAVAAACVSLHVGDGSCPRRAVRRARTSAAPRRTRPPGMLSRGADPRGARARARLPRAAATAHRARSCARRGCRRCRSSRAFGDERRRGVALAVTRRHRRDRRGRSRRASAGSSRLDGGGGRASASTRPEQRARAPPRGSRARARWVTADPVVVRVASDTARLCYAPMRFCLMLEGQEGVTWDDWVAARAGGRAPRVRGDLPLGSLLQRAGRPRARGSSDAWTLPRGARGRDRDASGSARSCRR